MVQMLPNILNFKSRFTKNHTCATCAIAMDLLLASLKIIL